MFENITPVTPFVKATCSPSWKTWIRILACLAGTKITANISGSESPSYNRIEIWNLDQTLPYQWRIRDFPEVGVPTYDFTKFFQKLHKIEGIWTPGARPKFYYIDPPLHTNCHIRYSQWRADPPLRTNIFLISCSFWENLYVGAFPWRVGAPSYGESWISPWQWCIGRCPTRGLPMYYDMPRRQIVMFPSMFPKTRVSLVSQGKVTKCFLTTIVMTAVKIDSVQCCHLP